MRNIIFTILLLLPSFILSQNNTITIKSEAKLNVPVDFVIVSVTIEEYGNNLSEINSNMNKKAIKLQKKILSFGIDSTLISTQQNELQNLPYSHRDKGSSVARLTYLFPLSNLNQYDTLKTSLIENGAKDIRIKEKCVYNIEKYRSEAYKQAFDNAKAKAEIIVSQTGKKIIGINKIVDGNYDIDRMEKNYFNISNGQRNFMIGGVGSLGLQSMESIQPTTKIYREITVTLVIQFLYK
jgi:uncharacterized protein YggE